MGSTFGGIETALRGILSHQQAVNTAAHNVSNASTPGYTRQAPIFRQRANYGSAPAGRYPAGGLQGDGVSITEIRRVHDEFLAGRMRAADSAASYWDSQRGVAEKTEAIVQGSGDGGLNTQMDRFWNAWQNLAQRPEDTALRTTVIEQGRSLAAGINAAARDLAGVARDARLQLGDTVSRINELAGGLAHMNAQIRATAGVDGPPNDLLDQRDAMLSELAGLTDVTVYEDGLGTVNVAVGNRLLVQDTASEPLRVSDGPPVEVQWEDGTAVEISQGQAGGLLRAINVTVPAHQARLAALRTALTERVNALHSGGRDLDGNTGGDFFTVAGDGTLSVAAALSDPRRLAASGDGSVGDSSVARAIAGLRDTALAALNQQSPRQHFAAWLSAAGSEAKELGEMAARAGTRRDSLSQERESVSGVNLDEEAANLVQWQRAFAASSRVLSALDEMLGTVIERMGV